MPRSWSPRAILAVIVLVGAALRLNGIDRAELWYDELQTVTHAVQPLQALLGSVWHLDPHPPVYYIQLHLWMMLGTGQTWLAVNAALFGILAIPSLYFVGSRLEGERSALWAAGFLAVSPLAMLYAQEVRMYAWLMLLAIWVLYFNDRMLRSARPGCSSLWYLAVTLCFLYSHGAAFLLLASIGTASALIIGRGLATRAGLRGWLAVHAVLAVAYVPWVRRALDIQLGHVGSTKAEVVGDVLALWLFGDATPPSDWMLVAGAAALVVAVVVGIRTPAGRVWGPLAIGAAPFAAAVVIVTMGPPVLHVRAIVFAIPFLALAFGAVASELSRRELRLPNALTLVLRATAVCLCGVLLLATCNELRSLPRGSELARLAQQLEVGSREPRTLYVEEVKDAWALCWLLVGPGSATPQVTPGTVCKDERTLIAFLAQLPSPLPGDPELWRIRRVALPPEQVDPAARSPTRPPWSYAAVRLTLSPAGGPSRSHRGSGLPDIRRDSASATRMSSGSVLPESGA